MSRMLPWPSSGADHVLAHGAAPGGAGGLLSWAIQPYGRRVIVRLDGELDTDSAPRLARQLEPLAETGSHLILDLAAVRFCDCAGLNLFVRLQLRASAAGGWMHLAEPTPAIRRLIALTGLYDVLPVEAGLVGAITAPAETPQPRQPSPIPMTLAWPPAASAARPDPVTGIDARWWHRRLAYRRLSMMPLVSVVAGVAAEQGEGLVGCGAEEVQRGRR